MKRFDNLTSKNALLYAVSVYDNPQCLTWEEWREDYKRFKYVKRLCRRYLTTGKIKDRLLLNHVVSLVNVFGVEATVRLLFLKCDDPKLYKALKPFLIYCDILPPVVVGVNGADIYTASIPTDERLLTRLEEL